MLRRLFPARTTTPAGPGDAERARTIRERLGRLDLERLELLADERVPGRKHRLDALAGARRDLLAELDRLDPPTPDPPVPGRIDRRTCTGA